MAQLKEVIELAVSGTFSYLPDLNSIEIGQWEITALGGGEVTFTPVIEGQTTHLGYTLLNDSLIVELSSIEGWELANSADGAATAIISKVKHI